LLNTSVTKHVAERTANSTRNVAFREAARLYHHSTYILGNKPLEWKGDFPTPMQRYALCPLLSSSESWRWSEMEWAP